MVSIDNKKTSHSGLVSIIVPVYNSEKYIERCMRSIVEQKYKNVEIVIVDDGSKDNSIYIAKTVLEKNNVRFKIIVQQNAGAAAARNTGVKNASGEWLAFVDSDDAITTNHIDSLLFWANEYNTDVVLNNFIYSKGDSISDPIDEITVYKQNEILDLFLIRKINIVVTAILIKKQSFIEKNLWFDETVKFGEDAIFYWNLLLSFDVFVYNNAKTYLYYVHPGSVTTAPSIERMNTNIIAFTNLCKRISVVINQEFSDYVFSRQLFSMLRISAVYMNYNSYIDVYNFLNMDNYLDTLLRFPDKRVRLLCKSLKYSKIPFFLLNRIRKR